ncbi:hypothetical protein GRJ2_001292900 [Grus japonensis]|uniref:Rna-directed dna polymerase from mobile element jockey-like n=1 Tax=Grus japonensis TaxID=30415 RepID=A0ABC9WS58_GRUJA
MSGVPQRSVLGLVLFNIFVGDMDSGSSAPSASLPVTPSTVVQLTRWREGMPSRENLMGLRGASHMKFNKAKCKVLHMGQGNPKHQYSLDGKWIESRPEEKDLGVLADESST